MYRSGDRGQAWEACQVEWESFAPAHCTRHGFGETNGLVELPDGSLGICCHAIKESPQTVYDWNAYLIRSVDGGRSWGDASLVTHTDEVSLLLGADGHLVAFPLKLDDGRLLLVYGNRQFPFGCQAIASRDGGHTWALDVRETRKAEASRVEPQGILPVGQ
jgi:hypothetical protein